MQQRCPRKMKMATLISARIKIEKEIPNLAHSYQIGFLADIADLPTHIVCGITAL